MKKVLIIEDEKIIREAVAQYFSHDGYEVITAEDSRIGLELFTAHDDINLIILDIMLPVMDGWSVCRRIRKNSTVPIILLTARSDEDDTLLGFELGADDYVTKPFKPAILLARAKRLFKETTQIVQFQDCIDLCGIYLDKSARSVSIDGKKVDFTHTEFEILLSLMQHKEQVLTRDTLITNIWGYDYVGDDKTLTAHMRNVRVKLGDRAKHITTVVRTGYKFEVDRR
ncbi:MULTISPECIES: response regulator transcription factor [Bacillus]|uniref:DNA-binding response OmpR family regulator n=1 Tax=Bacillus mycoides TaxID=1405 RepID=C2Y2X7_BACMY|nr:MULTISPECIES: response regulator transcription factor [Bacillus]EEL67739.1 Two-component response regulator [Bacillus mycoides]MCZ6943021.1 response regulator transcription factor [Bacillus mycoides]OOR17053.1 DNA-binding response regulator [Bacillus mycoides]QWG81736.1 response regulator transcription factor [Bacillus mycoides]RBP25781.1 DNA-binding response OmpR family regulator [Bacillus sp. DB-2]